MAERLAGGNVGLALLANALATGAMLFVLIAIFAPVSGAHFNPLVSLAAALSGDLAPSRAAAFIPVQIVAAAGGVLLAHAMFDLPLLQASARHRDGAGQWISEGVATAGLLLTIYGTRASRATPMVVALFITAAYWFTASTAFANPAVTLARALTDSFAGIAPASVPAFLVSQICGAAMAIPLAGWLFRPTAPAA